MATPVITDEMLNSPEYLQALKSRIEQQERALETRLQRETDQLNSLTTSNCTNMRETENAYPAHSLSRESRVTFAEGSTPPRESPLATVQAANTFIDLLSTATAATESIATHLTQRRRLTDYHERAATPSRHSYQSPSPSPPLTLLPGAPATSPTNGYLDTFIAAMREERRESNRQLTALVEAFASTRTAEPVPKLNKAIPQVQAMKDKEDLTEYFQLFESTQIARNNPREAWAHTLMPLLNSTCKSLALSLPATTRLAYSALKAELLSLATAQTEYTAKQFWERKKPVGSTWREEVATITKLLRRCTPGPSVEEVRGQILVEKLTQMLPKHIE